MRYRPNEIESILNAYRALFPSTGGPLERYFDIARQREWSYLTTDWHRVTPSDISRFDDAVRNLTLAATPDSVGKQLRDLSRQHGVGYSLGISPWTDDLLLRSFSSKSKRVLIVLGHDWYPIVTQDIATYRAMPPLDRFSLYDERPYGEAVPPSLYQGSETAVLFMNLYPDFRARGIDVIGSLGDYKPWVEGLAAVCAAIRQNFEIRAVVSWGDPVWQALGRYVEGSWRGIGIMKAVTQHEGKALNLRLGEQALPYYPFAHPSFPPNFKRSSHWAAYSATCSELSR